MPIPPDDVCLNKAAIIERSLKRAREEFNADPQFSDHTHIDAMLLNIERACQAAIDLAMHLCARERLGTAQSNADSFIRLSEAGLITQATGKEMIAMSGFRNIAIHQYQSIDMNIVHHIITEKYHSFITFCKELGLNIEVE